MDEENKVTCFIHNKNSLDKEFVSLLVYAINKVPHYTGFNWRHQRIDVSFSKKIKYDGISCPEGRICINKNLVSNKDYLFYILLHEAVHININNRYTEKLQHKRLLKKGHKNIEAIVTLVTKLIIIDFLGEKKMKRIKAIDIKRHKIHQKMWEEVEKLEKKYTLWENPLAFYLSKK